MVKNSLWTSKSIKMLQQDEHQMAAGRLSIVKKDSKWTIILNAFVSSSFVGEMYLIGQKVKKTFDILSKDGHINKTVSYPTIMMDEFIYLMKSCVVISGDKIIMRADISSDCSLTNQQIYDFVYKDKGNFSVAKKTDKTIAKDTNSSSAIDIKRKTIDKIADNCLEKSKILDNKEVKKILTFIPLDRAIPYAKPFKIDKQEAKRVSLLPMNWCIDEIKEALKKDKTDSPFAGKFADSKFVKIEIASAIGFDHMLVGSVPIGQMTVYMLCVPGKAIRSPLGLPEYSRFVPSVKGDGYWIKYIS